MFFQVKSFIIYDLGILYLFLAGNHTLSITKKNYNYRLGNILMCECMLSRLQWCPTLRDPMNCSPQGSSVPGILQASVSKQKKWDVHLPVYFIIRQRDFQ